MMPCTVLRIHSMRQSLDTWRFILEQMFVPLSHFDMHEDCSSRLSCMKFRRQTTRQIHCYSTGRSFTSVQCPYNEHRAVYSVPLYCGLHCTLHPVHVVTDGQLLKQSAVLRSLLTRIKRSSYLLTENPLKTIQQMWFGSVAQIFIDEIIAFYRKNSIPNNALFQGLK